MKNIFIAATRQNDGKTVISIGLFLVLKKYTEKIGFIKPVGQKYVVIDGKKVDKDAVLLKRICNLDDDLEDMNPIAVEEGFTRNYLDNPNKEELVDKILKGYQRISKDKEIVLIEGTGHAGVGSIFDLNNAEVAKILNAPVIIISIGGIGRPADEISLNVSLFKEKGVDVKGVGALYTKKFLEYLNCDVVILNEKPYGVFSHDPEPKKETLKQLSDYIKGNKADIGFAQDPDCDRLAIVDEKGNIVGEELVLGICLKNILEKIKTPVVVNLSTSMVVDFIAKNHKVKVYRTKIGEVNVVEKMKRVKSLIGGEGNGGVIYAPVHYGRDSFVAMSLILEYMAKKGKRISEIVSEFPFYFMRKEKFEIEKWKIKKIIERLKERYKDEKIDITDGLKIIRKDGWIHIRGSGTEPVLRLIVESEKEEKLNEYFEEVKSFISERF